MRGKEAFNQLIEYTKEISTFLKIAFDARGKRNWRAWDSVYGPEGFLFHYTASNAAVTPRRPLGRLPVLFRRFARNSDTPGVQLVAWDGLVPQFENIRKKYDVYQFLTCDVFCWGLDVAFFHGNAANGWAVGIENRNIGRLKQRPDGSFGWGKKGKVDYVGRAPVAVRGFDCEPFTLGQIDANVRLIRWLRDMYDIKPHLVLGHEHITSNRTDPSPHFPTKLVRDLAFDENQSLAALSELYEEDSDFQNRYDEWIEDDLEDLIVDSDPDLLFSRVDNVMRCKFEDDEGLYGEDGEVTEGDIVEAKQALIQLGYWPLKKDELTLTENYSAEFTETLKLFQRRWVKRKGRRWIRLLRDTGKLDRPTVKKLNELLQQRRFIT